MAEQPSILEYLTRENPVTTIKKKSETRNEIAQSSESRETAANRPHGQSRQKEAPYPVELQEFKDFNWETFGEIFNGKLSEALNSRHQQLDTLPELLESDKALVKEKSVEMLIARYNQRIIQKALQKLPTNIIPHRGDLLLGTSTHLYSKAALLKEPDWAGTCDKQGNRNILPGETKTSLTFKSKWIEESRMDNGTVRNKSRSRLGAVSQVLEYCIHAFSRYGFIVSNAELVILRVSCQKKDKLEDKWAIQAAVWNNAVVEFLVVPWKHSLPSNTPLSINLAIVVLTILAANDGLLGTESYGTLRSTQLIHPDQQEKLEVEHLKKSRRLQDSSLPTHSKSPEPANPIPEASASQLDDTGSDQEEEEDAYYMSQFHESSSWIPRATKAQSASGTEDTTDESSGTPRPSDRCTRSMSACERDSPDLHPSGNSELDQSPSMSRKRKQGKSGGGEPSRKSRYHGGRGRGVA